MATLYELTADYERLLELAEDPEADGYAMVIRELQAKADAVAAEMKRLKERKDTFDNNIARMKESLQAAMEATDKRKFKTTLFSFGIQKNPAKLVIDQERTDHAPAEYVIIQPPIWDKAKLKEALKAGKDVSGIAHLEQTESLRIR